MKILEINKNKTTVGHTGSNACGDDKFHLFPEEEKEVVVNETGKRITPVMS